MYSKLRFLGICFLLLSGSLCSVSYAADTKVSAVNELQVLIDVSGSMKKNDPHNLRIPAVKLLINLLPNGAKVGIWVFAEKTTELVKTAVVNKKWKKKALLKVNKIHSRGLFTDIETAIQTAAKDWFKSSEQHNRHLILLTDGMVDTSKDIMQSAESRARVMTEQVPLLQQAGVKVQTIALSTEADAELLDKLAIDTQGWSETALSADQLQKVFFKLFKQVVPQDSVPIVGNSFSVDKAVKEFSVLIFKASADAAAQLIDPKKRKITRVGTHRKVSWVSEKNYDLVTVKKPRAGTWKIIANMDPENQVMIVTDLKLQIDDLPNYVLANEKINITGFFTDQQQLISRKDFLSLIDLSIQQQGGDKWKMSAVKGKQGLYRKVLDGELKKGRHTLKIVANGKTFKREVSKSIEVIDSLITLEKQVDLIARTVTLELIPNNTAINADMMRIEASINQTGKPVVQQLIEKKQGKWLLVIDAPKPGDIKIINFSIMANTVKGQSVSPLVMPVTIDERLFAPPRPKAAKIKQHKKPIKKDLSKKTSSTEKQSEDDEMEPEEELEPVNWAQTIGIVVAVNLILIAAGFFGFKYIKKRATTTQDELLSRLD